MNSIITLLSVFLLLATANAEVDWNCVPIVIEYDDGTSTRWCVEYQPAEKKPDTRTSNNSRSLGGGGNKSEDGLKDFSESLEPSWEKVSVVTMLHIAKGQGWSKDDILEHKTLISNYDGWIYFFYNDSYWAASPDQLRRIK
ncbi:hypothetical protein [Photobacterium sp. OFAV2-7]|uniref:hypothetical protein n=1 Tax=Photobacterium sp. OFAV2-7 TaxID=2917748 RepID=UPI001EF42354|nr:hypothetical protein [Photobacterium sp. OFAV2-7]MCG7584572.1 hypothetical protein [Photobacterium sp. OFAV2-7]